MTPLHSMWATGHESLYSKFDQDYRTIKHFEVRNYLDIQIKDREKQKIQNFKQ